MNGYYFTQDTVKTETAIDFQGNYRTDTILRRTVLFFYRDGTVIRMLSSLEQGWEEFEQEIKH